jgi:integrase
MKIPARSSWHMELQKTTLTEFLNRPSDNQPFANKTINGMLVKLGGFFIWCHDHEYISHNPATKLQLKIDAKASDERIPYSPDDLQLLFGNLRPDRLRGWSETKYWIPLIALFSGARQNEICQLQMSNIIVAKGITCFQITECEEDDTKVKNMNSKRIVPIHPTLLKLGFLDYVLKRSKDKKTTRLWPGLVNHPKQGYAYKFQKFFGNFNRRYVTDEGRKVFHSLRHNFTNNLKQQGVQESMVAELVGHSVHSITFSRYGKAFNPEILRENLLKLDHGIDIFKILGKTPLAPEYIHNLEKLLPKNDGTLSV